MLHCFLPSIRLRCLAVSLPVPYRPHVAGSPTTQSSWPSLRDSDVGSHFFLHHFIKIKYYSSITSQHKATQGLGVIHITEWPKFPSDEVTFSKVTVSLRHESRGFRLTFGVMLRDLRREPPTSCCCAMPCAQQRVFECNCQNIRLLYFYPQRSCKVYVTTKVLNTMHHRNMTFHES